MSDPELLNDLRRQAPQAVSPKEQTIQTVTVLGLLLTFCLSLYVLATATILHA